MASALPLTPPSIEVNSKEVAKVNDDVKISEDLSNKESASSKEDLLVTSYLETFDESKISEVSRLLALSQHEERACIELLSYFRKYPAILLDLATVLDAEVCFIFFFSNSFYIAIIIILFIYEQEFNATSENMYSAHIQFLVLRLGIIYWAS